MWTRTYQPIPIAGGFHNLHYADYFSKSTHSKLEMRKFKIQSNPRGQTWAAAEQPVRKHLLPLQFAFSSSNSKQSLIFRYIYRLQGPTNEQPIDHRLNTGSR